jgi:hypothetical protein
MAENVACPVCASTDGYACTSEQYGSRDAKLFHCEVCGTFAVAGTVLDDTNGLRINGLNKVRRAALSHRLRVAQSPGREPRLLTSYDFGEDALRNLVLPSPLQQSTNAIRVVGNYVSENGEALPSMSADFAATIGAPSLIAAFELLQELKDHGLVTALSQRLMNEVVMQDVNLTLRGWEGYEAEKRGALSGNYGFIALKFGDPVLDPFLKDHIKPAVSEIGYDLFDMRDVAEAGIIDNLLRMQIRDAAFVLVDLTHENAGAYWEAGYAEGLGKPVLYICEKAKFDEKQTHFDTNHCTTVLWDTTDPSTFKQDLIATLRRSLPN